ncbi:DUF6270 domain-containing protein [Cellulomonas sp.]|uniref:DUF6270 domain-containing protein n=1 Tax=Cellulomonas sp. TaxID=40001 RepID=UPI0028117C7B|nr:DUF6270 domain-containing protein [Cellulomonas sp.]
MTDPRAALVVFGSCVSRDTYEESLGAELRLERYVARQSLISAFSPPSTGVDTAAGHFEHAFQRRMVMDDVHSRGRQHLTSALRADPHLVVLLDLVDERLGVYAMPDGTWITRSVDLITSGLDERVRRVARHVEFGSDEHLALWRAAFHQLEDLVRAHGAPGRAVAVLAPWATRDDAGEPTPSSFGLAPATANRLLEPYVDVVATSSFSTVSLDPDEVVADSAHRWGAAPFHYTTQTYHRLGGMITARLRKTDAWRVGVVSAPDADDTSPPVRAARRDPQRWGRPMHEYAGVEALQAAEHVPAGLLAVREADTYIDVLYEPRGSETTVVLFHAALSRPDVHLPFFAGNVVAQDGPVNRIFISDPGLYTDPALTVSWYAGTRTLPLQQLLVPLIERLARAAGGERLALVGPSSGGFAALYYSWHLPGSLAIAVNPQVDIARFSPAKVRHFTRACFDATTADGSAAALERDMTSDIRPLYAYHVPNHVLYVQNASDPHVDVHMNPFLEAVGPSDRLRTHLGDWGRGHRAPPQQDLRRIVRAVTSLEGAWGDVLPRADL